MTSIGIKPWRKSTFRMPILHGIHHYIQRHSVWWIAAIQRACKVSVCLSFNLVTGFDFQVWISAKTYASRRCPALACPAKGWGESFKNISNAFGRGRKSRCYCNNTGNAYLYAGVVLSRVQASLQFVHALWSRKTTQKKRALRALKIVISSQIWELYDRTHCNICICVLEIPLFLRFFLDHSVRGGTCSWAKSDQTGRRRDSWCYQDHCPSFFLWLVAGSRITCAFKFGILNRIDIFGKCVQLFWVKVSWPSKRMMGGFWKRKEKFDEKCRGNNCPQTTGNALRYEWEGSRL